MRQWVSTMTSTSSYAGFCMLCALVELLFIIEQQEPDDYIGLEAVSAYTAAMEMD